MISMRVLSPGMTGHDARIWQEFLKKQGLYRGEVTGTFDVETQQATVDFQRLHELPVTGTVSNSTLGMAMVLGLQVLEE